MHLLRDISKHMTSISSALSILVVAFASFCANKTLAQTILYPGTFDPFHLTHLEELQGAVKLKNAKAAFVFPVEAAYYAEAGGVPFPKLIPFPVRQRLIGEVLESSGIKGEARADPKVINRNVFEALLNAYGRVPDAEKYILIGTDVLSTWSQLQGFSEFVGKVRIIVSIDPNDSATGKSLQKRFESMPTIEFRNFNVAGSRAVEVKQSLFSSGGNSGKFLPASTTKYFEQNPRALLSFGSDLDTNLRAFFTNQLLGYLKRIVWPKGIPLESERAVLSDFEIVRKFRTPIAEFDAVAPILAQSIAPKEDRKSLILRLKNLRQQADFEQDIARSRSTFSLMKAIEERLVSEKWRRDASCNLLVSDWYSNGAGI
jgi:nicotinic acid mononucleotide adenylyltransferase